MKYIAFILIGVGIGYLLASDNKDEIISDIKDGFAQGKDYVIDKIRKTSDNLSEDLASVKK